MRGSIFLTARRRGSKKTFDASLWGHYEKSCQKLKCFWTYSSPPKYFMPAAAGLATAKTGQPPQGSRRRAAAAGQLKI